MSDTIEDLGTYTETADGKVELRFERVYPRPIATVWAAMTTPERLADWLGAVDLEPHVGGRFNCFINRDEDAQTRGTVLAWEPPRLLSFSWRTPGEPETAVRAELSDAGGGQTRLVFTHGMLDRKWMGLVFPGWHQLLERLGKLMATGEPWASPDGRWRALQAIYLDRYKLTGVLLDPPLAQEKYK
jgi:uncharacterized protein YndB with AHSA1/START domain